MFNKNKVYMNTGSKVKSKDHLSFCWSRFVIKFFISVTFWYGLM